MKDLIKGELLKLLTTRTFWWTIVAGLAFVPLGVSLAILNAGSAEASLPALASSEGVRNVMAAASSSAQVLLILGILSMAGEFRHGTATSTFLISPNRQRVVGAKLAAASLVGIVVAAIASALTLVIALPWLAARDVSVSLADSDVLLPLLGGIAATALAPIVGVGIGTLLRNQTVAVAVTLVWTMIVESILVGFLPEFGRWLPGGALSAMTGVATVNGGLLPGWAGALVFAGYGLLFAFLGTSFIQRRDVA